MVSACVLYIDDVELTEQKRYVPDELSALFQESDRVEFPGSDGGEPVIEYRASRASILKRLNLMGCTQDLARHRFDEWRAEQIEQEKYNLDDRTKEREPDADCILRALHDLTWEEWRSRIPGVLASLYDSERSVDVIERHMKSLDEDSWLWFDGHSSLISLRAVIEAVPDAQVITLDVGNLIGGGWIEPGTKICDKRARIVAARGQPSGAVIILAEGKSDIEVFKAAIGRFHPDLVAFVTFLDHREFRVDGGASYVVKFLKAFAAARVPANIVAIFDNDAAGLTAYRQALSLGLPDNMACIHLPDIELARAYPAIGPQGHHDADINGRACGIELYFGRAALSSTNGTLRPVRWTGFDRLEHPYQGEVEEKEAVRETFLAAMRDGAGDIETAYPEMQYVWRTILDAAARTAEKSQEQGSPPPPL